MELFKKDHLPRFLQSPENMEDHVDLYNFLLKKPEYAAEFEKYKKEFSSHIHSVEDFKEIYMYIDDEPLREKAKDAIVQLTGTKIL
ncbi:MAG: hypothetical protein ACK4NC_06180 [Candidatus Gracilibacteria bacterium]